MMTKSKKPIFLNAKQLDFASSMQKDRTWIGGRGSGKSYTIGASTYQKATNLPRSKGIFAAPTYNQILTKTLPPVLDMWRNMGLREHISNDFPGHFVVGKKPPANWIKPYNEPRAYKNIITLKNGFTIELLSMDRPDLARGGSFDWIEIDEAALVTKDEYDKILLPSLRGNVFRFSHPTHQQVSRYSSMPWKSTGLYLLDYKDKALANSSQYKWTESTAYDNVAVLGEAGIKRLEEEMDYHTFQVEMMNKPSGRSQYNFYYNFKDTTHCYSPKYNYKDGGDYGIEVTGMADCNKKALLELSFDFGGWFKCMTVYQERGGIEYMIDSFYKNVDKGLYSMLDEFITKYHDHENKMVNIWGEPRGHDVLTEGGTLFTNIEAYLKAKGWRVQVMVTTKVADAHERRYELLNEMLEEKNHLLPKMRINQDSCKDVIIAINNTDLRVDFKKDKKDEANKSFNQAHATHFTDTIDYYISQKYGWRINTGIILLPNQISF